MSSQPLLKYTKQDQLLQAYYLAIKHKPDGIAIVTPNGQATFAELEARSNTIAQALLVQADARVIGIYLDCGVNFYASLIACMKSGCLASLIDPLQFAGPLQSIQVDCLLSHSDLVKSAPHRDVSVILLDTLVASTLESCWIESPPQALHQLNTSGSSGSASRVTIGRNAVYVHYQEMSPVYAYQPGLIYASFARYTTAASLNHFWRVLLNSAGVLQFDFKQQSFHQAYQQLVDFKAQNLQGVASVLNSFFKANQDCSVLAEVKVLALGGEPVQSHQLKAMAAFLPVDCRFVFNYSSSETLHIAVFEAPLADCLKLTSLPCGSPLPSRRIEIHDPQGQLVARGQTGEIVVYSAYLALDVSSQTGPEIKPEIHTSALPRLRQDPTHPGQQVYLTRDRGRWNAQGQLEHLGRLDRLLKLRGQRIDPFIVEQALNQIDGIEQSSVVICESPDSTRQLVACLLGQRIATEAIRQALILALPASHVPTQFVCFDDFPRLASGKLDLESLSLMATNSLLQELNAESSIELPLDTPVFAHLIASWERILGRSVPSVTCHFMQLGGDSLKAMLLLSDLDVLGYTGLNPVWVNQYPTLQAQCEALQASLIESNAPRSLGKHVKMDKTAILDRLGWLR